LGRWIALGLPRKAEESTDWASIRLAGCSAYIGCGLLGLGLPHLVHESVTTPPTRHVANAHAIRVANDA
jgi:hypothetical protein